MISIPLCNNLGQEQFAGDARLAGVLSVHQANGRCRPDLMSKSVPTV